MYIPNIEYSATLITWTDLQDIFLYEKTNAQQYGKVCSSLYFKNNSICQRSHASKYIENILKLEYQIIHGRRKEQGDLNKTQMF